MSLLIGIVIIISVFLMARAYVGRNNEKNKADVSSGPDSGPVFVDTDRRL